MIIVGRMWAAKEHAYHVFRALLVIASSCKQDLVIDGIRINFGEVIVCSIYPEVK